MSNFLVVLAGTELLILTENTLSNIEENFDVQNAAIAAKQLVSAFRILAKKVPPKSFLASKSIAGISVLFLLEAGEILTGDPWSLNGLIKSFLLLSSVTLASYGRVTATAPLAIALPGTQASRPITPMTQIVFNPVISSKTRNTVY